MELAGHVQRLQDNWWTKRIMEWILRNQRYRQGRQKLDGEMNSINSTKIGKERP